LEASGHEDIASSSAPASRARRLLTAGAAIVALGIALVGSGHPDVGGPLLLVGWVALAAGIHRFGREA
jgi:hypothetical protein